jgi:hypothetical protein
MATSGKIRVVLKEALGKNLDEAQKPEYIPGKGFKFRRYGGLGAKQQKTNAAAPAGSGSGIWAFFFPHFDWYFLGGSFSRAGKQVSGRFSKVDAETGEGGEPTGKIADFFYSGPVYVRFDPDSLKSVSKARKTGYNLQKISVPVGRWHLTHTDLLAAYDVLNKVHTRDAAQLTNMDIGFSGTDREKMSPAVVGDISTQKSKRTYAKSGGGLNMGVDNFEVYIPGNKGDVLNQLESVIGPISRRDQRER